MFNVISSAIIGVLVTMLAFYEVSSACAERGKFNAPFISIKCSVIKQEPK